MPDFRGRTWVFGDDVNTDEIIPARYLNLVDHGQLARHVMEDADPTFASKVAKGDIIVAGKNFGCGSSREHAPAAIKAAGVSCVIAKSFARIFFRNAFNTGLPILESQEAVGDLREGDIVAVYLSQGVIRNESSGRVYRVAPVPEFMQQLLKEGGLVPYLRKKGRAA
ncbi:MAG: 3-isopropylmalate dehydratase small subunit [Desulfomonilaceae bacterium]